MSRSGTFAAVVGEVARGSTARSAARRLALPLDLVESMVEEAERMGLVSRFSGCSACPVSGPGCDGCPLPRVAGTA